MRGSLSARRHRPSTPGAQPSVTLSARPHRPSAPGGATFPSAAAPHEEVHLEGSFLSSSSKRQPRDVLGKCSRATGSYVQDFTEAYGDVNRRRRLQLKLEAAFVEMALHTCGQLTLQDFRKGLRKDHIKSLFSEIGVQPHLAGHFFRLVDPSGTGRCDKKEFVEGFFVDYAVGFWDSGIEYDLEMLEEMLIERGLMRSRGELRHPDRKSNFKKLQVVQPSKVKKLQAVQRRQQDSAAAEGMEVSSDSEQSVDEASSLNNGMSRQTSGAGSCNSSFQPSSRSSAHFSDNAHT